MREIIHIRLPHHDPIEEPLPPVTSDDDTRLYATQILHAATDAEFLANPSSLTHLNALCGVYTAAVARMDEAAAQRDVRNMVNVLQAFSSARRTCIWADKVFRRVFKRFSLAKENFLVLTAGAPPPTEPLFLVGQARKQVLASQALARSRYMTALIEVFDAAVTADTDDDPWQRACMAVKEAVSALLSENIQTYRSELEGPLIGAYITREKQQAAASPSVPSAAQCIARYTRLLQFAQATLHETSVEPVLRAAGSAIFSTPALLASVMPHFCSMEALSTMTGILLLSGLQIPGREAEWLTPAGTAIGAVLTARCRGNFEILLEEALNMLHAGVDSRMVARAVLSLSQTANEADTTALRIGRLVDRYVRMSAIEKNASAIHRLLVLFKPHVKADELLQHLSEFLTRRAASFNVPWTIKDEIAALDQVTRTYGVGRCARMRQLIADVADSEAVTSTVLSIFGGTPVLTSPRTQEAIHVGFKCFSHFYAQCLASDRWSGLPLPRSLRPIQDAVEMVYRDKFPRRSFVTLPQASTVVIDFFHANGAVTTISLLPAHLSLVEAFCDVAAHVLMRPEDLASALPEFAPEHISWCLDDLQAAGLVSLSAAGDGFRFEVPVTSKRVCVEDTRRRKLKKAPEAALSAAQRKALIDAAVVAIVKASDGIVRPELFRQCAARLTRVPTLSIREVNASVTRLIDLEYVQMDRDIISYRA